MVLTRVALPRKTILLSQDCLSRGFIQRRTVIEHILSFTSYTTVSYTSVGHLPRLFKVNRTASRRAAHISWMLEGASSIVRVGYEDGGNSVICYFHSHRFRAPTYSCVTTILCNPITSKTFLLYWRDGSCECAVSSNFFRAHCNHLLCHWLKKTLSLAKALENPIRQHP